jgi:hypothetical protein
VSPPRILKGGRSGNSLILLTNIGRKCSDSNFYQTNLGKDCIAVLPTGVIKLCGFAIYFAGFQCRMNPRICRFAIFGLENKLFRNLLIFPLLLSLDPPFPFYCSFSNWCHKNSRIFDLLCGFSIRNEPKNVQICDFRT